MLAKGTFLLAQPYLLDPNFKRAAILLVDHEDEGSVGFVLTHPLDWRITDVIDGFPDYEGAMYFGGPVQRDTLHFVHTLGSAIPESIPVQDDLYWGGDFATLVLKVQAGEAHPGNTKFFLGYSGWSQGQLDGELNDDTWLTAPLQLDLVFETPHDQIWPKAMRRLGNAFGVISEMDEESLN